MKKTILSIGVVLVLFSPGCWEEDTIIPRPKAYFRIDLPEKNYSRWEENAPFEFEIPSYCNVLPDTGSNTQAYWYNLDYHPFNAVIHMSYKPVHGNIDTLLAQSRELAIQHQVKASAMKERPVLNDSADVYGLIYEFGGNTASSIQFYLTDSTRHFVRGALYFWARPNADSLAPVLDFLREDIFRMVETFKWKDVK